jgi:hypothetical protein
VTEADAAVQTLAEQIAARGREALVERLRTAYADAAAAHADIVTLDSERIEAMVQAAADRADGLQWRRALANVASEELGLSLPEALAHPAVTRAQEIVGAPSYEASLAELIARPVPPPAPPVSHGDEPVAPAQIPGQEELFPTNGETPVANDPETPYDPDAAYDAEPAYEPEPAFATESLETVEADDQVVELFPEPIVEAPYEPEPAYVIDEEPPAAPAQPEAVIDEREFVSVGSSAGELEAIEADDAIFELMPPPEPIDYEVGSYEGVPEASPTDLLAATEEPAPPVLDQVPYEEPEAELHPTEAYQIEDAVAYGGEHADYNGEAAEDDELRVTAYHLGGVANLPAGRDGLDLRLSANGLDILQPEGDIIGRLHWNEIDALEVQSVRGRLRRSARSQSRVVVRTKHGDASFEVPGFSSDELGSRVDPLVSRFSAQN